VNVKDLEEQAPEEELNNEEVETNSEKEVVEETEFFFVLEYEKFPVKIQDPDTQEIKDYELREFPGNHRDTFLNKMRSKVQANGQVKDFTDLQASLVAMTLFPVGGKTPLTIEAVRKFPSKMLDKLYNKAIKMNALDKEAELKAKKT